MSRTWTPANGTRGSSPLLQPVPKLLWPQNVPSLHDSVSLMFEPARLPMILREPTLLLMRVFAAQHLAECPAGVDFERWHLALAMVFRLQAAATLADAADTHDEVALQALFADAAEIRDWLLALTYDALFESTDQAIGLRGLLQVTWDEVLKSAPPLAEEAPARPPSRTGVTRVGPRPQPVAKKREVTQTAYRLPEKPKAAPTRWALPVALVLSIGLFIGIGPRPTKISTGGAPRGWILAGALDPGPATLMSATALAPPRAEVDAWLEQLQAQGVRVQPHGKDEWLLTKDTTQGEKP